MPRGYRSIVKKKQTKAKAVAKKAIGRTVRKKLKSKVVKPTVTLPPRKFRPAGTKIKVVPPPAKKATPTSRKERPRTGVTITPGGVGAAAGAAVGAGLTLAAGAGGLGAGGAGGVGGGGGVGVGRLGGTGVPTAPTEAEVTWSEFGYRPPGAPDWWKAMKPSELNEQSEYLAAVNMMIPFLSPEDQRTVATQLYTTDPENFGHLSPETISISPPTEMTREVLAQYQGGSRAREALSALEELKKALGDKAGELGPGYAFLRSLASTVGQYGAEGGLLGTMAMPPGPPTGAPTPAGVGGAGGPAGYLMPPTSRDVGAGGIAGYISAPSPPGRRQPPGARGVAGYISTPSPPGRRQPPGAAARRAEGIGPPTLMTRTQIRNMLGAIDPLLAMTKAQPLSPYGPIAQAFALPFFSAGPLLGDFRRTDEGIMFGAPSPKLYF